MFKEKRQFERIPHDESLEFKVLTESNEPQSENTIGRIVDISPNGVGLITDYPLEAGHVLKWDDKHKKGNLHLASVRWSQESEDGYKAGAMLI